MLIQKFSESDPGGLFVKSLNEGRKDAYYLKIIVDIAEFGQYRNCC